MDRRSSWQHTTQPRTYCHHYTYFKRFFPAASRVDDVDQLVMGASRSTDDLLMLHRKRLPKVIYRHRDDPVSATPPQNNSTPDMRSSRFEKDSFSVNTNRNNDPGAGQQPPLSTMVHITTHPSTKSAAGSGIISEPVDDDQENSRWHWPLGRSQSTPAIRVPKPAELPYPARIETSMFVSVPEQHQKRRASSFLTPSSHPLVPSARNPAGLLRLLRSPTISSATSSLIVHQFPTPPVPVLRRTKRFSAFWIDSKGRTGKREAVVHPTNDGLLLSDARDPDNSALDASLFLFGFLFFPLWWYGLWRYLHRPVTPAFTLPATSWLSPHRFRQLNTIMAVISVMLLGIVIGMIIWYVRVS